MTEADNKLIYLRPNNKNVISLVTGAKGNLIGYERRDNDMLVIHEPEVRTNQTAKDKTDQKDEGKLIYLKPEPPKPAS